MVTNLAAADLSTSQRTRSLNGRFVVVVSKASPVEQEKIAQYFQCQDFKAWQCHPEIWLLAGVSHKKTPKELFADLHEKMLLRSSMFVMILDTNRDEHFFWGVGDPDNWKWMTENWGIAS